MKKILLSLFTIFSILTTANAESYTHTFNDGDLTTEGGTAKFTGFEWSFSKASDGSEVTWGGNSKGVQFGSRNNVCTSYSLSTSAFKDYTITSVTVYSTIASSGDAKLTIKAGNAVSEEFALSGTNTGYKLDCREQGGDIVISWEASKRAYYVTKIEVIYELPADMVEIEDPVFVTPIDIVYTNKVQVIDSTKNKDLVLYYTLDGTDPSYEDFNSDPRVGTTNCSKYWIMYKDLTDSITINRIRVMAVKVDGESVYKSKIVEATYVVSRKKPYTLATTIASGNKYALFANDSIADALNPTISNGFLKDHETTKNKNFYEAAEYNGFTFTATDGGYTIQDATDRYMYIDGTSNEFFFSNEKPATGATWNITINDNKAEIKNGNYTIYYVANEGKFGCYTSATDDMELPSLYMLREYPKFTITPEHNSYIQGLQEITITCNDGITVSDNFSLRAIGLQNKAGGYDIDRKYDLQQVDKNTLKFTIDTPIVTDDNINLDIVISGDIILNPDDIKYPLPIIGKYTRTICSYTHVGSLAAATIISVEPANGSKVESLSYILFTFSNIATTVDTSKEAKLYKEGSDETIPFTFTNLKEDGTHTAQEQGGLLLDTPVTENGTYILEIADGYFVDRNSKEIKGIKLKYTVENETSIEDIIAIEDDIWVVYNTNGIKVLETEDANRVKALPSGIYIINGIKVIIK